MARIGKIARLSHDLREEVNLRLFNGETSPQILAWLNAQPEAIDLWARDFEEMPASAENLSQWRKGGYQDWRGRRERVDSLKTLSVFASDLVRSGGDIADGAAAILSGQILEALEQSGNLVVTGGSDDAEKDPNKGLVAMASAVASMQKAGVAKGKLELDRKKVAQKDEQLALDREKFETQTVGKFFEWAKSAEAAAILDSGKPKGVQMEELRRLMFGPAKEVTDAG